ncbi:MAG: nucleoside phosphorylase [Desulfobacterales bacterium]|nr:nucleoside phosphorylase [Desulfobacterales bacterium]
MKQLDGFEVDMEFPIVKPKGIKQISSFMPNSLMISSSSDLNYISKLHIRESIKNISFLMSNLYAVKGEVSNYCLVGPFIGAPYAIILFETLVASGAKFIIMIGWCGSICDEVKIGDIIVPSKAIIDEGTSIHYGCQLNEMVDCSNTASNSLKKMMRKKEINFIDCPIWTTDAIYRETPSKIEYFKKKGAKAVDMETSAFFSSARHHNVDIGCVLIVSDELSSLKWNPGFQNNKFVESRKLVCDALYDYMINGFSD